MADLPQQNTIIQYSANGTSTDYNVTFFTPLESDGTPNLDVFTQLSTAPPLPTTDINIWNVDYTYIPNLDPTTGGIVRFTTGNIPPSGYVVTIVRNVSASLNVEFANATTFSGITLDAALDKLLLISQQNKSYTLGRNLSYIVNSYLPDSVIAENVQIPVLGANQVWFGSSGGVIAATLQQPANVSTLRSELANEAPVTNGAHLIGYYDSVNVATTTVEDQLTYLTGYVLASTPTGAMLDFAGNTAPAGFLACNGASVLRATYPDLFAVIGVLWGSVDGTHFTLPDFRRRVAIGSGGTGTATIGNAVGNIGGLEKETLTDPLQLPSHTHNAGTTTNTTFPASNVASGALNNPVYGSASSTTKTLAGVSTTTIDSTGASAPFNIIQPSAIVLKIIKT